MSAAPNFASTPRAGLVRFVTAEGTAQQNVLAAGTNGTKVTSLRACSDDSSVRVLQLSLLRGGTNYVLGSVSVPALSGTDGATPAVDLLAAGLMPGLPADNDGQPYLFLQNGDALQLKPLTAVTSAKAIDVSAIAADF